MKIKKNTSAFDTRFLRKLFCKVHSVQSKTEGKCPAWKRLEVTVRGSEKQWRSSGHAYVGTGPIVLTLRDNDYSISSISTRGLAELFWHEMMHVYGYQSHRGGRCDAHPDYIDEICEGLPEILPRKERKAKAKRDIVVERYRRLLNREVRWTGKLQRAQNALKKVERERRAYERRHGERLNANASPVALAGKERKNDGNID